MDTGTHGMLRVNGRCLLCHQRCQGEFPSSLSWSQTCELKERTRLPKPTSCHARDFYVQQAIKMGQATEIQDHVYISTIVEDVPMILNRSIERATRTLSDQAIMAVANRATELLSPDSVPSFAGALQQLVHDRSLGPDDEGGAIDQFSRALERQLDEEEGDVSHEAMIYAVNSMDCAVSAMQSKLQAMSFARFCFRLNSLLLLHTQNTEMRDMFVALGSHRPTGGGPNMVQTVAQELGRILKQYETDYKSLLADFVSRYTSSGRCGSHALGI